MKHKIKRVLKKLLRPITYLFEDDHAPTHKAWLESIGHINGKCPGGCKH